MTETNGTTTINEWDVLSGRGGRTNLNTGNRRFRAIVASMQREYLTARKKDKVLIARQVVDQVHANGGRFLKRGADDCWVEVSDKVALSKSSQALRESLNVREKTFRPTKMYRVQDTNKSQIVEGKVIAGSAYGHYDPTSPAIVSLQAVDDPDMHSIPDLHDDEFHYGGPLLPFHPKPLDREDIDKQFEV